MNKHTPGPWETDPTKSFYVFGHGSLAEQAGVDRGPFVCNASSLANARLIAAAPDLLQFAQAIEDIMQSTGHNLCSTATHGERTAFIDRIICAWNHGGILAIAKAKGEE